MTGDSVTQSDSDQPLLTGACLKRQDPKGLKRVSTSKRVSKKSCFTKKENSGVQKGQIIDLIVCLFVFYLGTFHNLLPQCK